MTEVETDQPPLLTTGNQVDKALEAYREVNPNSPLAEKATSAATLLANAIDLATYTTSRPERSNNPIRDAKLDTLLTGLNVLLGNPYDTHPLVRPRELSGNDIDALAKFIKLVQNELGAMNPDGSATVKARSTGSSSDTTATTIPANRLT